MTKWKREKSPTLQEFLLDVYTMEKETSLARIRGTEKGLEVIRKVSELWTKEDMQHTEEIIVRLRRFVLHLNALKIIVRQHTPSVFEGVNLCQYCAEVGQTIEPEYPCDTLRWLAMPYLDYPKFDPKWAVRPEQFEDLSLLHRQELHENVDLLRQRREKA